jgi:glycosyltransferase 2 family protein
MKLNWKTALGIALSAGLLVWTLRGESPSDIWAVISRSNVALLIVAALVATAVFPLRALRWRVILEPVAPNLPVGQLWRATAVGMMVNNIYPARLGEIARA